MGKHLVFVYGTLKRGQPNYDRLFGPSTEGWHQFQGTGETVDSYPFVIASSVHIPFVLALKGSGNNVHGELYLVDDVKLEHLDRLENHPLFYTRTEIPVRVGSESVGDLKPGSVIQAGCYLLFDFNPDLLNLPFLTSYDAYIDPSLTYVMSENRPAGCHPMSEVKIAKD